MSLGPGTRLGPYEIIAAIGAGGMGEVYRARDTRLDRTVAIKILAAAVAADPTFRERFDREARAVAALNHPHICALYDIGEEAGIAFLVMEYLEGETLADRLAKGALPIDHALQYAIQIAEALDKAHRAGIIHRDLKPGNIILTKSGAKLLDFGLAKTSPVGAFSGLSILPTAHSPVTAQGTILGTLQYMAPEQVEGREADALSDIFAFGAILYEMVTGQRAFDGKSQASVIAAILEREPPVMSTLQPLTPPSLERVISTCLVKNTEDRWQSARDLLHELNWVGRETTTLTGTTATSSPRRLAYAGWLVAAITLATLAVLAFLSNRATSDVPVTRLDLVTPSTSEPFSFALSPDGLQITFVANAPGGGAMLWLRPLNQVAARPLAGTEGASYPFWAPDSRAIGFFGDGKLKRIDLASGTPQVLADAPSGRGGTWNQQGVIVFAPMSNTTGLMRVMATGGIPIPVTRLAAREGSHRWPQFLPDGRRVLFFVGLGQPQTHGVYVASLDGGEPTRVLTGETAALYAPPGFLLHVSQGMMTAQPFDAALATVTGEPILVAQAVGTDDGMWRSAVSVSAAGVLAYRTGTTALRQLVWVDRLGKTQGTVGAADETGVSNPAIVDDSQRIAITRTVQGNPDVWMIDPSRGTPTRFTFDAAFDNGPVWSPEGREVVFNSSRKGFFDLFEKPANGATDEQPLLVTAQDKNPLDWSRDGRFLLYAAQDPKTASDIWALPLTGERKPFPVVQTSFDEIEGQFSPDGRWLAYASNESGRYEIYIRPFPEAGGKWQVSTAGGTQPRWRRDATELYYVAPDGRLTAAPIRLTSEARTVDVGAPVALFPTRLASGANILTAGYYSRAQYAVASDGRFLMNVAADEATASPITIVLNWDGHLKD